MRSARILALAAALALLAACADTPTAPIAAPGGPSLDEAGTSTGSGTGTGGEAGRGTNSLGSGG
jgi:uncharacterized lipoprotein YajG